jgi:hypothetical protein
MLCQAKMTSALACCATSQTLHHNTVPHHQNTRKLLYVKNLCMVQTRLTQTQRSDHWILHVVPLRIQVRCSSFSQPSKELSCTGHSSREAPVHINCSCTFTAAAQPHTQLYMCAQTGACTCQSLHGTAPHMAAHILCIRTLNMQPPILAAQVHAPPGTTWHMGIKRHRICFIPGVGYPVLTVPVSCLSASALPELRCNHPACILAAAL